MINFQEAVDLVGLNNIPEVVRMTRRASFMQYCRKTYGISEKVANDLRDCLTIQFFSEYVYRSIPMQAGGWHVSGVDNIDGSCGILEWCYDEFDAERVLSEMQKDGVRFTGLKVSLE